MSKLKILAVAAHPDDAELAVGGLLAKHSALGDSCYMLDLTAGEMASRGTPELREKEAEKSREILGVRERKNLGMRDGFLEDNEASQMAVIKVIREWRPDIMIITAPYDRHPDHGTAHSICKKAFFKSGLVKIETGQEAWRPKLLLSYCQERWIEPDIIFDISATFDKKMESIGAYSSQFYSEENDNAPATLISTSDFWKGIEARARFLGRRIGVTYGEGLNVEDKVGMHDFHGLYLPQLS